MTESARGWKGGTDKSGVNILDRERESRRDTYRERERYIYIEDVNRDGERETERERNQ